MLCIILFSASTFQELLIITVEILILFSRINNSFVFFVHLASMAGISMNQIPATVVFLCKNNSARSQMAEAILRRKAGTSFSVFSAGLGTKPIKPTVFEVMEEMGYSLEGQESKTYDKLLYLQPIDHAIIVCKTNGTCSQFDIEAKSTLCWEINSPFPGQSPTTLSHSDQLIHYRSLRDQLLERIDSWHQTARLVASN